MSVVEFGACWDAHVLIMRRYSKSPWGEEEGAVWAVEAAGPESGNGRVRVLPKAQMRGAFGRSEKS